MSIDFPVVSLGDLIKVKGGKRLPKGSNLQYEKNDHPYIRIRDMGQRYLPSVGLEYVPDEVFLKIQRYIVEENDVVISIVGTIGLVSVIDKSFHLASQTENCAKLNGLDRIDALCLYYYLVSTNGQQEIKQATIGAVQAKLPLYNIEKIAVAWPIREYREQIVKVLSVLDDKIELNTQTNQTLEAVAQAIFKSWFVDFEPVKAKMAVLEAGGTAEEAERAAMCAISGKDKAALTQLQTEQSDAYAELAQTAALFPSAMQDSELGEMPEGWEVTKIAELAKKISKGTTPSKNDISSAEDNEVIPFLKVRDITDSGEIARIDLDKIPKSIHCGVLKRSILEVNDILFSIAGTIGRVAVVEEDLNDCNCNQAIAFIRLKEPEIYLELCRLNLIGYRVQSEVASKVVQGVQANFSLTSLGEIQIINPTVNVLNKLNETICGIGVKQKLLLAENRRLSELRDFLLPKLLSGEIDLSQAADMADEVSA